MLQRIWNQNTPDRVSPVLGRDFAVVRDKGILNMHRCLENGQPFLHSLISSERGTLECWKVLVVYTIYSVMSRINFNMWETGPKIFFLPAEVGQVHCKEESFGNQGKYLKIPWMASMTLWVPVLKAAIVSWWVFWYLWFAESLSPGWYIARPCQDQQPVCLKRHERHSRIEQAKGGPCPPASRHRPLADTVSTNDPMYDWLEKSL